MTKRTSDDTALNIVNSQGTNESVANQFGVSKGTVNNIRNGHSWSRVTGKKPSLTAPPPPPPPPPAPVVFVSQQRLEDERVAQQLKETFDQELYAFIGACIEGKSGVLDCLIEFSSKKGLKPEGLSEAVKRDHNLLAKLTAEMEDVNVLPKKTRLPI